MNERSEKIIKLKSNQIPSIEISAKRKSRRKKRNESKNKEKIKRTEISNDDSIENQILNEDN